MTGPGDQRETLALLVASRDEPGVLYRVCEVIYQHDGNITYIATVRSATDAARNTSCAGEANISAGSRTQVLVIPAQENWMVARECVRVARRGA